MAKLTPKQKRFCEEYLIDLNATQAYKRAGYSAKKDETARVESSKLLANPNVSAYIRQLMDERAEKTGVTAEKVVEEVARVAFAEDVQIRSADKVKALELLMRHIGILDGKKEDTEESGEESDIIKALRAGIVDS